MNKFFQVISRILDNIICFLYPPICISCEEILPIGSVSAKRFLCEECFLNFNKNIDKNINDNTNKTHAYAYVYSGMVQECVYKFKYGKRDYIARGLGVAMAKSIDRDFFCDADFIIPVPIHKKRYKRRGFNQAELLAKYLCKELSLSNVKKPTKLLKRTKYTKPMAELAPSLRKISIKDAFSLNSNINIADSTIIIVDDIYTTGATLDECAKILYENGAKKIKYATLSMVF